MSEPVRVIRIAGTYTGRDPVGWHLMARDRESVAGGPFASYADAMLAAGRAGLVVENAWSVPTHVGDHADDVDAARDQVARGE